MNFVSDIMFRVIRRLISAESGESFSFVPSKRQTFPRMPGMVDFYVHIPYCRNHCRWCPYNTRPYCDDEFPSFFENLLSEVRQVISAGALLYGKSLYIGGGTPTCTGRFLLDFIDCLVKDFGSPSTIAVETSVDELTLDMISGLKASGVAQLSIGVQSFNGKRLQSLGRVVHQTKATDILKSVAHAEFENVNVDLMHDVQRHSLADLGEDIHCAADNGADQITIYPLFRFFTSRGVCMPQIIRRRRFYSFLWNIMQSNGYVPVSVWSFCRPDAIRKFSSVQRRLFVGLGPGAATSLEGLFAFNTFDCKAWMQRISSRLPAYSLEMPISANMRALYDLYWDMYELHLPKVVSEKLIRNRLLNFIAQGAQFLGLCDDDETLTQRGAFWIHLMQNQYVLNYINKVWSASMRTPFPNMIRL
ncbi:MAG: radical SAM protein [Kiritimatiellae bacterium]|nr:radical SAM protein [Kiritimatiellia bacterium]